MSNENNQLRMPHYDDFLVALDALILPISASELHGVMCGYLCAGAVGQGESYLRALLNNKKDKESHEALVALFSVYSISQQQIANFDFEFELLLPSENEPLAVRSEAFSEWCQGFINGLNTAGIDAEQFYEEEAQEAYGHVSDFSELDVASLSIDEEDERALMEISEYTRMAVLRLHSDLVANERARGGSETTH
ncbi:MAG: UPF0149 family protein [Legionellales bacterium]